MKSCGHPATAAFHTKPRSAARGNVFTVFLCLLGGLATPMASAEALGAASEKKIRAATFEIVIPKPQEGVLEYERPLPLELLPFAIRQDKYQSIGTAFSIENGRFVTAAHVLTTAISGSHASVLIREQSGAVHELASIVQFSLDEDYAVFTVADDFTAKALASNATPVIGDTVHATGNAFGEGIVIRDGLLTSETPEEREGAWKWLRFSAAASPGNSGGPLLDAKGRVIGVVLGVSPNENLNFALPIARVLQPQARSSARLISRQSFGVPIAPYSIVSTMDKSVALPLSYAEFSKVFMKETNQFFDESLAEFLRQNESQLFPNGDKSKRLLSKTNWVSSLQVIAQQTNGDWDQVPASRVAEVELPTEGELQIFLSSGVTVAKLVKPSEVALESLFTDSKSFMDLILKGLPLSRPIADQMIRITSFGPATSEAWHVDRYGRRWLLRTWPFRFADVSIVVLTLPKPDGADLIFQLVPTGMLHPATRQMIYLSDFAYTGYYASLGDWQAFLGQQQLIPETFKNIAIELESGKRVRFTSPRFRLDLDNWLQDINEESRLDLQFAYFVDGGKVKWEIANCLLGEDRESDTFVKITRWSKPAPTSSSEHARSWAEILAQKGDFAGKPRYEQPTTSISKVLSPVSLDSGKAEAVPEFMYTVTLQVEQFVHPDESNDYLQRAIDAVELLE